MAPASLSPNRIVTGHFAFEQKSLRDGAAGRTPKPHRNRDDRDSAETQIYRRLAKRLGVPFISFPVLLAPSISPAEAVKAGLAPADARIRSAQTDLPIFIYAPEGEALAELAAYRSPLFNRTGLRLGIVTPRVFQHSIRATFGNTIADAATHYLPSKFKEASALSLSRYIWICLLIGLFTAILASMIWSNMLWHMTLFLLTCFPVLPGLVIKLMALQGTKFGDLSAAPLTDADLPTYTVLVPVYKEAAVLPQLLAALSALDYPPAKLDVKLLIEADDVETLSALDKMMMPEWLDVLVCPRGAPRTKPRALQIGLAYTKSELVVVYDAEDIPEPDQLKKAAAIFSKSDRQLACLQARLAIDNLDDSWLAHQFALEYAALFDVLLPGLAYLNQPIPLGGTSNHFRRQALCHVGGWDPWNVTEDADLGLRLFRAGYQVKTFNSTTHEEAPAQFRTWSNQRSRWLKGWLQTGAVHMRLHGSWRDRIDASQRMMLILTASLSPLTLLFHPAVLLGVDALISSYSGAATTGLLGFILNGYVVALFLVSFVFNIMIVARGAYERKINVTVRTMIGMLPYSCLKTWAAWRGLFELLYAPFMWRKTDHGLARTSRLLRNRAVKTTS